MFLNYWKRFMMAFCLIYYKARKYTFRKWFWFICHSYSIWPNALLSLNFLFLSYNQQRKYFLLFKLLRFEFLKPNTYCSFQTTGMVIKIENYNVKCKLTWNSCVIRVFLTWLDASLNKIYTIKCDKLK